ncbi:Protein IMPACT -like protein [Escovopsis weberi]|uniref:Protein IMPACT-like protein n=1 Tax=Escovopsis weberi TaxID=150374 RepID=A0A0M8MT87_ESCWE|nr:Protein IMPACT -like protein [Escovopsis weberi]
MSEELFDEIEVINSIYGASTLQPAESSTPDSRAQEYILTLPRPQPSESRQDSPLRDGDKSALRIRFPEDYPAQRPVVLGAQHSAGGRRGAGARDAEMFAAAVEASWAPGGVCVFDALEEYARARGEAEEDGGAEEDVGEDVEDVEGEGAEEGSRGPRTGKGMELEVDVDANPPEWIVSDVVVESKSTFVARVARITTAEQPGAYLAHLLQSDRRVRAATHNMLAWRVRLGANGSANGGANGGGNGSANGGELRTAQDFDDDGETAAGSRLLKLMQAMGVWDAMVVVTRWYGGVKLGPRRFAVINGVARDGFVRAGMVVEGKKKKR